MIKIPKLLLIITLSLSITIDVFAQTPIAVCPQLNSFTGMTRGYHFTAPTNFTICGLYVEDDMSTLFQSVAIVRFNSAAPPAFNGTTKCLCYPFSKFKLCSKQYGSCAKCYHQRW